MSLKSGVKKLPLVAPLHRFVRGRQQEEEFRRWREKYATSKSGPSKRDYLTLSCDASRPVHTFAIIPSWGWHDTLLPELETLGPVTRFDYAKTIPVENLNVYNRAFITWRKESNAALLRELEKANEVRRVDWVFAYAQGDHLLAETINQIRNRFKIPTVNMCLDDKNSWSGPVIDGQPSGSIGLVAAFDLWWTSARVCVDWINAEGGRGFYLPEGCSALPPAKKPIPYSIPVSFVGAAYGARPQMIEHLRKHGIQVETFGQGWGKGSEVSTDRMNEIYQNSQINLGHGGIGYSEAITNVKGRDFEIPNISGGAYLTTFNPDLAQHFRIDSEILCWHSYDDLLEQIRYYLKHPKLCHEISSRARKRCAMEHRWSHRFQTILKKLQDRTTEAGS